MSSRFEQRLAGGAIVVGDGGMGVLVTSAVPRLRCPEEANLRAPDSVVTLHTSFIRAGADLIETNTFGANRHKLAQHYLEDELERINGAGVKLAREANGAVRGAGRRARRPRHRPLHDRDLLRPRRARERDRSRTRRLLAPDRRHANV